MGALGRLDFRLAITVAAAVSTVAVVAISGAGAARSFAIFVVSTAVAVTLATLLEPIVRGSGRA